MKDKVSSNAMVDSTTNDKKIYVDVSNTYLEDQDTKDAMVDSNTEDDEMCPVEESNSYLEDEGTKDAMVDSNTEDAEVCPVEESNSYLEDQDAKDDMVDSNTEDDEVCPVEETNSYLEDQDTKDGMVDSNTGDDDIFVYVGNIPKEIHSKHMRCLFKDLVDSDSFTMFHYVHRPEDSTRKTCCSVCKINSRFLEAFCNFNDRHWEIDMKLLPSKVFIKALDVDYSFSADRLSKEVKRGLNPIECDGNIIKSIFLDEIIELHPVVNLPRGNVGTSSDSIAELIEHFMLPPKCVNKLGFQQNKSSNYKEKYLEFMQSTVGISKSQTRKLNYLKNSGASKLRNSNRWQPRIKSHINEQNNPQPRIKSPINKKNIPPVTVRLPIIIDRGLSKALFDKNNSSGPSQLTTKSDGASYSGFGVRILQKHGWTPGIGLGLKNDGTPDVINYEKRHFKDRKGIGFTGKKN